MQSIPRQYLRKSAKYLIRKAFNKTCLAIRIYTNHNSFIPMQRRQGLKAGRDILNACDTIIIGARHGISEGMAAEINAAAGKHQIIVI